MATIECSIRAIEGGKFESTIEGVVRKTGNAESHKKFWSKELLQKHGVGTVVTWVENGVVVAPTEAPAVVTRSAAKKTGKPKEIEPTPAAKPVAKDPPKKKEKVDYSKYAFTAVVKEGKKDKRVLLNGNTVNAFIEDPSKFGVDANAVYDLLDWNNKPVFAAHA